MQRNLNSLIGFHMGATDGEIGKVKDFYFDDESWTVRYLVVKTGNWLSDKKVLISPTSIGTPDFNEKIFPTSLTTEQIKNSPDIDTEQPVSRQHEMDLNRYYSWPQYWGAGFYSGGIAGMVTPLNIEKRDEHDYDSANQTDNDRHLRSADEVEGYKIHAVDGEIGKVKDYIIDDQTWEIRFIVVDTGNWLSGNKVLISPTWIKEVQWDNSAVVADLTENAIKNSPVYDESKPL
ncbi:MAG TPA: PRC-barrel domain-containing protein, partial [Chitinophagaceae bacterium]|nr:PRC-barrel domain-containing protein [Chitinophagaceae bacterium]